MKQSFGELPEYDAYIEKGDMEAAYENARKVLCDPIDPETFRDIYGQAVDSDKRYVDRAEQMFKEEYDQQEEAWQNMFKLGKIFEAIVFQHAELSNWFGENATTIETSRYDDIKNGVDTIVEFEEDGSASHIALAVDVTSSASTRDKFLRIKAEIDQGHLAEIKYFVSEPLNIRGHKANIPRVVIGADRKTIYNVVNAWLEKDNKALAEHPIQVKILSEIAIQLDSFRKYCEKIGQRDLAEIYSKGLAIIQEIMDQKKISPSDLADLELDEVYRSIKMYAESIADTESSGGKQ